MQSVNAGTTFAYPGAVVGTNGVVGAGDFAHVVGSPPGRDYLAVAFEHTHVGPIKAPPTEKRLGLAYSRDNMARTGEC